MMQPRYGGLHNTPYQEQENRPYLRVHEVGSGSSVALIREFPVPYIAAERNSKKWRLRDDSMHC